MIKYRITFDEKDKTAFEFNYISEAVKAVKELMDNALNVDKVIITKIKEDNKTYRRFDKEAEGA